MKKTLIALVVATLPAAAFADVTIYGQLKGGIENVDAGGMNKTNVDDLGSRIRRHNCRVVCAVIRHH